MTNKKIDMLKDEADTHQDKPDSETIGSLLRQSREKMGASVADIAEQLHLRPCIVEDIEADNFDEIASPTYVKGYVKNFARIVQADKKAIQRCLANQVPQDPEPQMQSFSRKTTRQARDGRLTFVTYLIAFILLALLVLWWVQKSDTLSSIDFSQPTAEEIAASQNEPGGISNGDDSGNSNANTGIENLSDDAAPLNVSGLESSERISVPASGPNDELGSSMNETETKINTQALAKLTIKPVSQSIGQSALALSLSADCWINVTDAAGKVLINDLKKAGSQLNVSGEAPFKLTLGAPQAVSIELNGEAVSLVDYPSGRVARLTVPSAG
ncbi:DUF4115 domain-containing protein [Shewanella psychropiezotolerans]|uniref:DUF4115 domain-containing protein n=1 Tax=Shewanella psychropiezotolerans TaxID=2593655 RepID=A0ABX5X277_9GAMM|nr:RodZ domain-containing protein [Shewanella psychropiezotolerans]QDO83391.1 DUF4115 domain-containing protein [Shewanella psychropiezotolerans]